MLNMFKLSVCNLVKAHDHRRFFHFCLRRVHNCNDPSCLHNFLCSLSYNFSPTRSHPPLQVLKGSSVTDGTAQFSQVGTSSTSYNPYVTLTSYLVQFIVPLTH